MKQRIFIACALLAGVQARAADVFADLLYWYASEETTSIWASIAGTTFDPLILDVFDAKNISLGWDFGARFGLGCDLERDGWDTQVYWSWFSTHASSRIESGELILPEFFGSFVNGDHAQNGTLQWTLLFNMGDWELGRKFRIGEALLLRPFVGIKGGWINQAIRSRWQVNERDVSGVDVSVNYTAQENLKNNFWGVGPSGGVNTTWNLWCSAFSLAGDASAAMLWGTWKNSDVYTNTSPANIAINLNTASLGGLMARGFLGIAWEASWNRGKSEFSARAGYEMQIWLNQLRIPTFQQIRLHGDLTLQGGTLDLRIAF